MGNRRLYKIEYFHGLDTPESERGKVTALNLFHPTASPRFQKVGFLMSNSLVPILPAGYREINLNYYRGQLERLPYLR